MAIQPVILAGGLGSRLWPLSRQNKPKQFLDPLEQGKTLFQQTVLRAVALSGQPPIIVANKSHRFLILRQLKALDIGSVQIILEPEGRNTAASIMVAALHATKFIDDARLVILPCDHYIADEAQFAGVVNAMSSQFNLQEGIGLIGVKPSRAATEYGYLKLEGAGEQIKPVARFIEKPCLDQAAQLIADGGVAWNSGVVISSAQYLLRQIKHCLPGVYSIAEDSYVSSSDFYGFILLAESFLKIKAVSFDYGVLEKSKHINAGLYLGGWDDLGSWESLLKRRDQIGLSSVFSSQGKEFIGIGGDSLVVDDEDVLLVVDRGSLNEMREGVEILKSRDRLDLLANIETVRPWGEFKILSVGEGYMVKQLIILPGAEISLQSHQYRQEHWVVVNGSGVATLNGVEQELTKGSTLTVKQMDIHRLSNHTDERLEVVEVQMGESLSELDIVRYDDKYSRHTN